ncbi:STAS domain-containing protein [Pseudooceanicola nanhaiensis]|jgi:anti-sigma B factor antagonist|uniref:Anti-sigma factor antagonist n=1 Tax=Pseudooceanicola nanhaiensis TaxID=375761 RepID=A0A917WDR1_9RHOB|nr:STAS domain-containing protein [Pseudooceanicola nanhaiensis]GGL97718.1 anti-sigma factor antagonist [Pseudooceanicola nanhaiensis]
MELDAREVAGVTVISVHAERIDAAAAIRFKDAMRAAIPGGPRRIVLDLGAVDFIDSSGLGAIVSVMKGLAEGQRLDLAALQPKVDKVFRLTRMDSVFAIHADLDRALGHHAI